MKNEKTKDLKESTSKTKEVKTARANFSASLHIVNPDCAGIDMHKEKIWVCTSSDLRNGSVSNVSTFDTDSRSIRSMVSFLKDSGVKTVALESTGVYWMPTYAALREAGMSPVLINPSDPKRISGRPKTDKGDCIWICRLHHYGLLRGSFIADEKTLQMQELLRAGEYMQKSLSKTIQKMIGSLIKMNIRLDVLLSNVAGTSGLAVLKAVLEEGVRSPEKLYELLNGQIKAKTPKEKIIDWLDGRFDETSLFVLQLFYKQYKQQLSDLEALNAEILRHLEAIPKKEDRAHIPQKPSNYREDSLHFPMPLRPIFFEIFGTDLTQIPGIGADFLLTFLGTVGTDLSAWPDAKHFSSWLGLTPVANVSAGFSKHASTKKCKNILTNAFRTSAMAAKRTKTYIGCGARALSQRIDAKKARIAVARKLSTLVFNCLKFGKKLFIWTEKEYEERTRQRKKSKFIKQLVGYFGDKEKYQELVSMIETYRKQLGTSGKELVV